MALPTCVRLPPLSSMLASARTKAPSATSWPTSTLSRRVPVCPGLSVPSDHSATPPVTMPPSLTSVIVVPAGTGTRSVTPCASAAVGLPKLTR